MVASFSPTCPRWVVIVITFSLILVKKN